VTVIRHYQGPIPWGRWVCEDCLYETEDIQAAADHADENGTWVFLFAPARNVASSPEAPAMMEMHPSDIDGVYLNFVGHCLPWKDRRTGAPLRRSCDRP
jgi:hypothetical protein